MKFSKKGYLRNSPDVNKPQNIIQGDSITMKGVDFKVHGVDNNGYAKVMTPGYDYNFPNAKYVTETPIKNKEMNGPFKMKPGRGDMPKTGKGLPKDMTNPIMQTVEEAAAASRARGKMASVEADIRAGKHKPGKKVKVTTSKGIEREIDTRSQYYKTLQKRKEKKQNERSGEFKNVAVSKNKIVAMQTRD